MQSGLIAQKRDETLEYMRLNLATANTFSIAGDYLRSEIAMLSVRAAMAEVIALDLHEFKQTRE
jgi:hypothetical protein